MIPTRHGPAQGGAHAEGVERDTDYKCPWHMEFSEIVVLESSVQLIYRTLAQAITASARIH